MCLSVGIAFSADPVFCAETLEQVTALESLENNAVPRSIILLTVTSNIARPRPDYRIDIIDL